jgi:hypothetical protein
MLDFITLLNGLWFSISSAAPEAVVKALLVLLSVFVLRFVKVIPSSNWARATNVVMSVLLAGVNTSSASQQDLALFAMTAAFSSGAWDLIAALWTAKKGAKPFA